jgi:transcriptional regulator GlxA family with amidase domain
MTKFLFLILPEVHLLDLAGPNQVISEAIDLGADFEIEYCGIEEQIQTSAHLGINKLNHFSKTELKSGDYVIIPGSRVKFLNSFDFKQNSALIEWILEAHRKGVTLVTICVGTYVVGEAGLLDNIECTTHFDQTERLQKRFPKAIVKENILFTNANNIYTSAGIASGIDLMLHIIEKHTGGNIAHRVARELVVYKRRDGVNEQHSMYFQYRDHIHNGIHKVQDYIIDNIHKKLYLHALAEMASMSERNFSRVFKKETGITVHQFITNIRVEQIKALFKNPDLSRKQIAKKVGLLSEKQVGRLLAANG